MLLTAAPALFAQEAKEEPKIKIQPTGRILMDGAIYATDEHDLFKTGVAVPDARLGVKATYGNWKAKVDVGFAYGKVGLKDIFFEYDFNESNLLRLGSFIHQYGLQSATSSSMKCTMEEPTSNEIFNNPRQIGLMYVHSADKFFATASAHVEPQAMILTPTQTNEQGYGLMSRLVYRPIHSDGVVVQAGISGGFATPSHKDVDGRKEAIFSFNGNFPTRVNKVSALGATVDEAMNQFKFTPELLLSYGPLALESQYFYNQVNRRNNLNHFTGQGAYVTARGLILGGNYGYSMADAGLATPGKGALECVLSYNYTDLVDQKAGIFGGRINDLSCTFNYYINKYMIARFRYSYTHRWDRAGEPSVDLNAFQLRLQVIF